MVKKNKYSASTRHSARKIEQADFRLQIREFWRLYASVCLSEIYTSLPCGIHFQTLRKSLFQTLKEPISGCDKAFFDV